MNTKLGLSILLSMIAFQGFAQNSEYQMKGNDKVTTIDFLSSYYNQDGDNAAVTGGVGTEELTDFANVLIVNLPFDSINSISVTLGGEYYTSASTDNIDNNPSSASSKDLRQYGTVSYSRKNLRRGETYSAKVSGSTEYDYTSVSFGLSFAKEFNEGNSELSLNAQMFRDNWKFFLPVELRGKTFVPTSLRNSYNFQATFAQVLNQRMQFSISAEAIYMEGLLSTPFHRVYFNDQSLPDIERLPDSRLKIPVGIRFNYFPMDALVIRSYYRFYVDDWGLQAHTFSLETPVKVNDWLTLSPFYRFNTQNAVDYFAPFSEHSSTEEFYTSDHDLSGLTSHKIGLGFRIAPLYGISRNKWFHKKTLQFKNLEVRTAYYKRSTDLTAFIVSMGLNFEIK
ncbi:MAG: hypothetical protein ACI8YQ_003527 [Polaribacter sp.]|jgi:hypothetical protein